MEPTPKDRWDKAAVILRPVGGLLTAMAVALLGLMTSSYLEKRQQADTRTRLYTELISKREQAESALRKDMFTSIMDSFLEPGATSVDASLLKLELLACNFHESLNLRPLFLHLERVIEADGSIASRDKEQYQHRLRRAAREVVQKQVAILETGGVTFERDIFFDDLRDRIDQGRPLALSPADLTLDSIEREFTVYVWDIDPIRQEVRMVLDIATPGQIRREGEFSVGFFDFPMIDNTRLPDDQRCAIVLNDFEEDYATIRGIFFPASHASIREKPYFQEMLDNLMPDQRT